MAVTGACRTSASSASAVIELEGDQRQHAGDDQALVERVHDLAALE
jgi:hypothetical protein